MKQEVIVIGSGLGGLECANLLARAGKRVLLLEQGSQAGGCLQSYKRHGLAFDTGFHYVGGLGEGQSLYAPFRYLGLLDLPWKQLDDDFDHIIIGKQQFVFRQGLNQFVQSLSNDFPTERHALENYAKILQASEREQLQALNPQSSGEFSPELLETSAYTYLSESFRNPLLRNVLSGTSLKMELRRESLPLFTFAHGNSSFIESSWRLQGDGSLLVQTLINNLRAHGGEIICRAEVSELVEQNGQITTAICSNGERYEGDVFISDVHPALTCQWVKQSEQMKRVYRRRIAALENTFGMFTVSLRLKPGTLQYFNHNYYVYREANVWDFYLNKGPVSGLLISCRAPQDGAYTEQVDLLTPMLWEQCQAWSDTRIGQRGPAYEEMKQRLAEECIELAGEIIPNLKEMVVETYTSTPLTYRDYTDTPEGSAYGLRKDFRNPLLTLLSPRTPIPNLLLTGQNLVLHGIHGVTMTALLTCAEILGKEWIWEHLFNHQQ